MPRSRALVVLPFLLLVIVTLCAISASSQVPLSDHLQIAPPLIRSVEPPASDASAESLEQRGDDLRKQKLFLDALDYYRAAIFKSPSSAALYNKMGITELLLQRWAEAKKDFERAIKYDHQFADAYNNLGVIYYVSKKYGKAIGKYDKAIELRSDSASFYSNLGAAYFAKKDFQHSVSAYSRALQLDPDVFERTSHAGISAQMSKPEDRAHYDYVVAKLYAKMGISDRSLQYLRRAMEEGYKDINNVYKDAEFASLRKDPRFAELMSARPLGISD
jgi:tetratricopeptide (TPR) repeat protein